MASKKKAGKDDGSIAENRRARYDYEIGDTLECGIVLVGAEVKSLRNKAVAFADAYADIHNGELWLHNVKIDRYAQSTIDVVEPTRKRRLLANKAEIDKLTKLVKERGYTLIPLKLYFKDAWAKCLIGLARGKDKGDKRDTIRKREADRDVSRALRRG
jgi:SsrA-binding protein